MRETKEGKLLSLREYRAASRCPRYLWFLLHPEERGRDGPLIAGNPEKSAHIYAIKALNYRFIEKQVESLLPKLLRIDADSPGCIDAETRQALEKAREHDPRQETASQEDACVCGAVGAKREDGGARESAARPDNGVELHEDGGAPVLLGPGVKAGDCFARLSLLFFLSDGGCKAVTISPATKIKRKSKDRHDLAVYTFHEAGINITQSEIWYINSHYRFEGRERPRYILLSEKIPRQRALFISKKVDTGKVLIRAEKRLSYLRRISALDELPAMEDDCCSNPYTCPFAQLCKPDLKPLPSNHIFTLHKGARGSLDLYKEGYLDIADIPSRVGLGQKQEIQRKAVSENKVHLERELLESFFEKLEEPLYFLDFETVSFPFPIYENLKPYAGYPFLYSLRKVNSLENLFKSEDYKLGGEERHFFSRPGTDRRNDMARRLSNDLAGQGSILVYDAKTERAIIHCLAESDSSSESNLKEASNRLVDLHSIFTSFSFYHPDQKGKTSLKSVFPVLSEISYDDLTIRSGIKAGVEYLRMSIEEEERGIEQYEERVRRLSAYCSRDSLAVIRILGALKKLSEDS